MMVHRSEQSVGNNFVYVRRLYKANVLTTMKAATTARNQRRLRNQRCNSLADLPPGRPAESGRHVEDDVVVCSEFSRLLTRIEDSPVHSIEDDPGHDDDQHIDRKLCAETVVPKFAALTSFRPERATVVTVQRPRRLERTTSIPSALFNRVKESICEVFHTSRWPTVAAVIHERRRRSADEFEARLCATSPHRVRTSNASPVDAEAIRMNDFIPSRAGSARKIQMKSDPEAMTMISFQSKISPVVFERSAATGAFRRRSVSEDTYHTDHGRQPTPGRGMKSGGIICSNDDFKAIVLDRQRREVSPNQWWRYSPRVLERSVSAVPSMSYLRLTEPDSSDSETAFLVDDLDRKATRQIDPSGTFDKLRRSSLKNDVNMEAHVIADVTYDGNGQSWDVRGAAFDPEILGDAIQKHLEKHIHLSNKKSTSGDVKDPNTNRRRSSSLADEQGEQRERTNDGSSSLLRFLCLFSRGRDTQRTN